MRFASFSLARARGNSPSVPQKKVPRRLEPLLWLHSSRRDQIGQAVLAAEGQRFNMVQVLIRTIAVGALATEAVEVCVEFGLGEGDGQRRHAPIARIPLGVSQFARTPLVGLRGCGEHLPHKK